MNRFVQKREIFITILFTTLQSIMNAKLSQHSLWHCHELDTHIQVVGYRLNCLDKPVFIAVSKPLLTEFGIHNRLESCVSLLLTYIRQRLRNLHGD